MSLQTLAKDRLWSNREPDTSVTDTSNGSYEGRPSTAKLRMFDGSELQRSGVITLTVKHPHTARLYDLDFYVATKHEQPLHGFKACSALDLLRVVDENICECA